MYFLGIDGGGTRTRAWLCDRSGTILGEGRGGPSNPCSESGETCRIGLSQSVEGALGSRDRSGLRAAHLGVAGANEPAAQALLASVADGLFDVATTRVAISHDLKVAHAGALAGQPGAVLVAGTGSACYGEDQDGNAILAGGWGDLIDDAGSGSWIGLRALQLALRQADGSVPGDTLLRKVLQHLGLRSTGALKTKFHLDGLTRKTRAQLAPVVLQLAESGDAVAAQIVDDAVGELSLLVRALAGAQKLAGRRVVPIGGLTNSTYFRERLEGAIASALPDMEIAPERLCPTGGAVLLAMRAAAVEITEPVLQALSRPFP